MQQELAARSKHGLALARRLVPGPEIEIRFFDGRKELIHPVCCSHSSGHIVDDNTDISWNRLVAVDVPSSPATDPLKDPAGFVRNLPSYGGSIVEMDLRGQIVARSAAQFWPAEVALSHAGDRFALVSMLRGPTGPEKRGIYVGRFDDVEPRKIATLTPTGTEVPYTTRSMVDWSSTGESIVLSHDGAISLIDLRTGTSHKVADGRSALWSPSGEWISYITLEWERALLSVSTGKSELIDPGKKGGAPLEWSPDGKYLLIPEGSGSHVPFGCLWVYRIADRAWAPVPDHYGMAGPRPHWVQLQN